MPTNRLDLPANAVASLRSAVIAAVATLAIAAVYLAIWILWPVLKAGAGGNDMLFLADGARRIAAGQTPHVDFSLPTGVIPYLTYLAAERLIPAIPPYIGAHLIGFLLLSPLIVAAGATFRRIELAVFLALVALAALLPFNVTLPDFYGPSFHASYNRLGSAFAIAYLAWILRSDGGAWEKGLLTAYALVFAFFLKIVFVGVVLAPAIVLALTDARWRRGLALAALVFGLVLAAVQLSTGVVTAYVADIRSMSAINAGSAPYFLASFIFRTFALQLLVWGLIGWLALDAWRLFREQPRQGLSGFVSCFTRPAAIAAAVAALTFAESQGTHGLEFVSVAGALLAREFTVGSGRKRLLNFAMRSAAAMRTALVAAALTLSAGGLAITDFENGLGSLLNRKGPPIEVAWLDRFITPSAVPEQLLARAEAQAALANESRDQPRDVAGRIELAIDRSEPSVYLAQWKLVDEAIAALGAASDLGPVLTLANVEQFGLALGAAPVKGVTIVHDVGRSIAPMTPERARRYLAGAQTVFAPTCVIGEAPGPQLMSKWFAEALASDFEPKRLTPCWTMHRRKAPGA